MYQNLTGLLCGANKVCDCSGWRVACCRKCGSHERTEFSSANSVTGSTSNAWLSDRAGVASWHPPRCRPRCAWPVDGVVQGGVAARRCPLRRRHERGCGRQHPRHLHRLRGRGAGLVAVSVRAATSKSPAPIRPNAVAARSSGSSNSSAAGCANAAACQARSMSLRCRRTTLACSRTCGSTSGSTTGRGSSHRRGRRSAWCARPGSGRAAARRHAHSRSRAERSGSPSRAAPAP